MFPFDMLEEALGRAGSPASSERVQFQDNQLGARYVTLVYGIAQTPGWVRYPRKVARGALVATLVAFSGYLFTATIVYRLPSAGTLGWLYIGVLAGYALDILTAVVQMVYDRVQKVPFLLNSRRRWGINQLVNDSIVFLEEHSVVGARVSNWWYGGNGMLNFGKFFMLQGAPFVLLWVNVAVGDSKLSPLGDECLALALGVLLLAILLTVDGLIRFSSWEGVPPDKPGYGLSILLNDIRSIQLPTLLTSTTIQP